MSAWATTWAYKQHPARSGEKFVLVTLAQFADATGYCYPGQGKLARLTEMGERTVRGHLDSLERQGILRSEERRRDNGSRTSNGYWLLGPPSAFVAPDDLALPAESAGSADQQERDDSNRQILPAAKSAGPEVKASKEEPKASHAAQAPPSDEIDQLCSLLAEEIVGNGGSAKKYQPKARSKTWRNDMRLLLDDLDPKDGPPAQRVERAIRWCQADDFWSGRIFSPANLRKHYDALRKQAISQASGTGGRHLRPVPPPIPETDLSKLPPKGDAAALDRWADEELRQRFGR